jgi:hypothetical protein
MLGPSLLRFVQNSEKSLQALVTWVPALIKLELVHDCNHVIVLNIQLIWVSRNVAWIAEADMAGVDFPLPRLTSALPGCSAPAPR